MILFYLFFALAMFAASSVRMFEKAMTFDTKNVMFAALLSAIWPFSLVALIFLKIMDRDGN